MGLLSLVEQPTRYDSGVVTLRNREHLGGMFVHGETCLHDYRNTGVAKDLWSELGMPKSFSLVPSK